MPLMSLAATAIDQPQHRDVVIETMLQYVPTDPILCRVEPGVVADKQAELLNPILDWVKQEVGAVLEPSDSIFGAELLEDEADKIRTYLQGIHACMTMEFHCSPFIFLILENGSSERPNAKIDD